MAWENAILSENQNDVEPCLAEQAAYEAGVTKHATAESTSSALFSPVASRGRQAMNGKGDRKSTRLNSSHANISYAGFCLKKKNDRYSRITHLSQVLGSWLSLAYACPDVSGMALISSAKQ